MAAGLGPCRFSYAAGRALRQQRAPVARKRVRTQKGRALAPPGGAVMKEYCGEVFSKLELAGEELSGLLLEDCLFQSCRFTELSLVNCRFSGCRFVDCKVAAPKLRGCQMFSCDFENCALSGVDWSALLDERKREMGFLPFDSLSGCSLRHCVFFGLDLKSFNFSRTDLSGSVFDGCHLEGASFQECRLGGTSFAQNDLSGADFRGAEEYFFSLESNRVKGVNAGW